VKTFNLIKYLYPDAEFALTGDQITLWQSDRPQPTAADLIAAVVPLRRLELHAARRAARTAAETGGFIFNGHPFDSDRDSILRIANAATTALTANLVGAPFATAWHCADGYDMPLDAAGVMAMQGALAAHGQACHDRSSALRALIDAPEADLDALAAAIKTGWPSTTLWGSLVGPA
jgi:hypothetical protein